MTTLETFLKHTSFVKISHRGNGFGMENSLNAIENASFNNVAMIEFDVQLTKDNVCVLFHDKSTKRLFPNTNLCIYKTPFFELESQCGKNTITTLSTLFEKQYPCFYYLEIKTHSKSDAYNTKLVNAVTTLIKSYKLENKIMLVSFNSSILKNPRIQSMNILKGLNIGHSKDSKSISLDYFDCICPDIQHVTSEFIDFFYNKKKYILPYGNIRFLKPLLPKLHQIKGFTTDSISKLDDLLTLTY